MLQERIAEIKRIASQIASVKSDMGRFEEQLEDCRRYRDFLYKLSPEEWRQEQEQRVAAIRARRKAAHAQGAKYYCKTLLNFARLQRRSTSLCCSVWSAHVSQRRQPRRYVPPCFLHVELRKR